MTDNTKFLGQYAPFEWTENGPYPMGKYSTLRDAYLHEMCMGGWANESDGDVAGPVGYFYRISIEAQDVHGVADAFGSPVRGIVGHFLVTENDQGFVSVWEQETERMLIRQYRAHEKAYSEWLGPDND